MVRSLTTSSTSPSPSTAASSSLPDGRGPSLVGKIAPSPNLEVPRDSALPPCSPSSSHESHDLRGSRGSPRSEVAYSTSCLTSGVHTNGSVCGWWRAVVVLVLVLLVGEQVW